MAQASSMLRWNREPGIQLLILAVFAVMTVIYLSVGAIPIERFGHDVVYMLDWGWRIHNGQIPHNDIPSLVGGGFLYLCAGFLALAHYDLFGFSLMNPALTAVGFGCLSRGASRKGVQPGATPSIPPREAGVFFLAMAPCSRSATAPITSASRGRRPPTPIFTTATG